MDDPISNVLPEFMHFAVVSGAQFVFLLGMVMFFGALFGRLFQRLKIPQVVGYIVLGIAIGASGLQVLRPTIVSELNPVNTVALSLIGFLVGGELKIGTIRKYGKQFVGILLFESIVPFFTVGLLVFTGAYLITHDVSMAFCFGIVLGSISSATAPAATTDVLKEFRTRGPLTTTVLGIVAMDDAVALILYAASSTIAAGLIEGGGVSFAVQLISICRDIVGSIVLGSIAGFILSFVVRSVMQDEGRILSFTLGALFLCTGICVLIDLDNILAAMAFGFFMVNFAPVKTRSTFKLTEKFTPPIYVLFFVLVGAKLNIWLVTPFVALLALLYIIGRTIGKSIGARIGSILTQAPSTVRDYLPFCLLSQAGVAIGLSIAAGQDFTNSIGPQILLIITATTFIVQLLGPICVKYGVQKAGECYLDVTLEDIKAKTTVGEVAWNGIKACSSKSLAIVEETATVGQIIDTFERHSNLNYAVKGANGKLAGIIYIEALKESLYIGDFARNMLAVDIMASPPATCTKDSTLPEVYKLFDDYDVDAVPIVSEGGEPLGVMERFALDHYLHARILDTEARAQALAAK